MDLRTRAENNDKQHQIPKCLIRFISGWFSFCGSQNPSCKFQELNWHAQKYYSKFHNLIGTDESIIPRFFLFLVKNEEWILKLNICVWMLWYIEFTVTIIYIHTYKVKMDNEMWMLEHSCYFKVIIPFPYHEQPPALPQKSHTTVFPTPMILKRKMLTNIG